MGSETVNSIDLFHKFLWIIAEGICDINLKGTDYLHSFVLTPVLFIFFIFYFFFFFVNKYC